MSLPKYINIHTHRIYPEQGDSLSITNKYEDFEKLNSGQLYSLGIHPWYIHDAEQQLAELSTEALKEQVNAIGECGLDKLQGADFALQQLVFRAQIAIANHLQKPLVIHCVRAYEETLSILQTAKVPVIFHGFNKNIHIAERILKRGYYLSFGCALLSSQSLASVFAAVSLEQIFLETDDADVAIKDIYKQAAALKNMNEADLVSELYNNYITIFRQ